jgi:hypothetical protein
MEMENNINSSESVKIVEKDKKTSTDLPFVVFLRGDEDFFEEFSWDADKVMAALNIRRSRLNQISGKELRVGKKKVDRYIRPVYRPCDVYGYLEWTRPTASHQRSSKIMDAARQKLEDHSEKLKTTLESYDQRLHKSIVASLVPELIKLYRFIKHESNFIQDGFEKKISTQSFSIFRFSQKLEESLEQILNKVSCVNSDYSNLQLRLNELEQNLSNLDFSEKLLTSVSDMEKSFKFLQNAVADLSEKINKSTLTSEKFYKKILKEKESVNFLSKSHPSWDTRKSYLLLKNKR